MSDITRELELLSESGSYSIQKNGDNYHITDFDHDLEAIYYARYDNWDYGVILDDDTGSSFATIDIVALNKLVKFTRKLSENES